MKKHLLLFAIVTFLASLLYSQSVKSLHESNIVIHLPDGSGVCYTSTIIVSGYNPDQVILSAFEILSVSANMEHSYLGDLTITLEGPNGQTVQLQQQGGGGTYLGLPIDPDYDETPGVGYDYSWDNNPDNETMTEAAESVSTLPAGTYAPSQSFSNLIGCPLNGPWTIIICDNWSIDDGYIFGWSLDFATEGYFNHMISGYVFSDLNENNVYDGDDYYISNRVIQAVPGPYYGYTNSNGYYQIFVPEGIYYVSQEEPQSPLYQGYPTEPTYHTATFSIENPDSIPNLNFIDYAEMVCPDLSVDITMDSVGPCSFSFVYITYKNSGTITAENSYITLSVDENFEIHWIPSFGSVDENIIRFDLGNIEPGETGTFGCTLHYSCDLDLVGTTVCLEAHIYPDTPCEEPAEEWDQSSIMVTGECVDNEDVCFSITNTGEPDEGDMDGTSEYRVYENDVLVETGTFQLIGGETITYCWLANGSTIRLEADQRPFHPGNSHPQESIESCGEGNTDTGFVLNFPQDDADDFIEIECQEVLSSFDPNDKTVTPKGVGEQHIVDSTTLLEYKIRFQNTGTAPAQNIFIYDTISSHLNITTFCHMSSSHQCTIDIIYPNVIRWNFPNINLADSTNNEPESHGFVKYKINQISGNEHSDIITNSASIVFDYNYPVITNEVFNTIGYFTDIISPTPNIYNEQTIVNVYPNPTSDNVFFELNSNQFLVEIYNLSGQKVFKQYSNGKDKISWSVNDYSNGMYFYSISTNTGILVTGKLVIEK